MKMSNKIFSLSFVSLLALYPCQDVLAGKTTKPPPSLEAGDEGRKAGRFKISRIFGLKKKPAAAESRSPGAEKATESSSATSSTSVSFVESPSPHREEGAVASTAMTTLPLTLEPSSREARISRKAAQAPDELSFEELTIILNAPLVAHGTDAHGNTAIIPLWDPQNPKQFSKEYKEWKGPKTAIGEKVDIGNDLMASHKVLDNGSLDKLQSLLQCNPSAQAVRLASPIHRSLHTMGSDYTSIMSLYALYNREGPIPGAQFIVSFYKRK